MNISKTKTTNVYIMLLTDEIFIDTEKVLKRWYKRAREAQFAHYKAQKIHSILGYSLGIPAAITSTFIGGALFYSLEKSISYKYQIIVGIASIIASTLVSIQTFLKPSEKSEMHRITAAKYGMIRRKIEQLLIETNPIENNKELLSEIRKEIDRLAIDAPTLSIFSWHQKQK